MRVGGQRHAPVASPPVKSSETGWAPGADLTAGKPTGGWLNRAANPKTSETSTSAHSLLRYAWEHQHIHKHRNLQELQTLIQTQFVFTIPIAVNSTRGGGRNSNEAAHKASSVTYGTPLFTRAVRNKILQQPELSLYTQEDRRRRKRSCYGRSEVEEQAVFSFEEEIRPLSQR